MSANSKKKKQSAGGDGDGTAKLGLSQVLSDCLVSPGQPGARHFPLVPEVYPDEHAFEIRSQFARVSPVAPLISLVPRKVVFICFTNRCGSNFFAQAIASDGQLRQADEFICWDTVRALSEKHEHRSLIEYLNWLAEDQLSPSGYFACKLSLSHLLLLFEEGVLDQWRDSAKFIFLYREDIIAQAVSLNVAWHTKQWTSEDRVGPVDVPFKTDQLFEIARSIALRNAYFPMVFELLGIEPMVISYEDFSADTVKWTSEVGRFLGLSNLNFVPEKVRYRKQADSGNLEVAARLRSHFRLRDVSTRVTDASAQ